MDQIKVNGQTIRRLKENVRFYKTGHVILTDYAIQYLNDDVLHMNGNTIMINGLDTLTCDSMVYWSKLDSGYAMGKVNYVQPKNDRRLTTERFYYWKTAGYRGSSFIAEGYSKVIEPDQLITANEIIYHDETQMMELIGNASVENSTRGIFGDEMVIQYRDSLIEKINIISNANAYNDLNIKIEEDGPYRRFRDEMSSKKMIAHFMSGNITKLELMNMATTLYNVIRDSLLVGNNEASGDSIHIDFTDGNIKRIQVSGGALGKFNPEGNNSNIDTIIFYGANYIDYHINDEKTFLSKEAYVEYENTKLSAGKIVVDWQTNLLDAVKVNDEYPMVMTLGEAPMRGNSMVFDLIAKHGRIDQGRTSFNKSYYHGKEVFRDDPNVFHVKKSKYTSCELDHPHYYLASQKMKMLPGDRVIAKPLWLYIYDIPIIGIPFAVFPNKGGNRHSGWIMPSFDSYNAKGTGFTNFGYYWAPNDYMDAKTVMNFFDREGIHINSSLKYKRRHGQHWYNYKYNGDLLGTYKRRIKTNEISDLAEDDSTTKSLRLTWSHNHTFDPTQSMRFKYEYISSKNAYQNDQEVNLQNRLKQNLSSSFNYNKNWQTTSFSIGINQFRDLSIENNPPPPIENLINDIYLPYKYEDGPKINFSIGNRKVFGPGGKWYNSLTTSYTLRASRGRNDHWLIKESDNTWADNEILKRKFGGIRHSARLSAPLTFFRVLKVNPNLNLNEDWVFNYKIKQEGEEKEEEGFKRRLTWDSSISAKTDLYGLFPINIGKFISLRHVISPRLSFTFQPDFSDNKYGGQNYFQQLSPDEKFDYFQGSYVGSTSHQEKKVYSLSVNNIFQGKINVQDEEYKKANLLTWNSTISYDAVQDTLYNLISNLGVRNFIGEELLRIKMKHNFYRFDDNDQSLDDMINIWRGESPQLTYIDFFTNMKFKLFGSAFNEAHGSDVQNISENNDNEFIDTEDQLQSNTKRGDKIWETHLDFRYSTNWRYPEKKWDYTFSLYTTHNINLSRDWALAYTIDFNIKEKEIIRNTFSIRRPIHCWEFSFSYWPGNSYSAGFSLQINVKNPDLQDIKITSKDGNRGFSGY